MPLTIGFLKVASVEQNEDGVFVVLAPKDNDIQGSLKLKLSQEELENIQRWGGSLRPGDELDISLL